MTDRLTDAQVKALRYRREWLETHENLSPTKAAELAALRTILVAYEPEPWADLPEGWVLWTAFDGARRVLWHDGRGRCSAWSNGDDNDPIEVTDENRHKFTPLPVMPDLTDEVVERVRDTYHLALGSSRDAMRHALTTVLGMKEAAK